MVKRKAKQPPRQTITRRELMAMVQAEHAVFAAEQSGESSDEHELKASECPEAANPADAVEQLRQTAPDMSRPMLSVKGVSKRVGRRRILNEISFDLPKGYVLGLLGPNGAGKTSLMRLLAGLSHPTRGRLTLNGDLIGMGTRGRISYLADGPMIADYYTTDGIRGFYKRFFKDFDVKRFDELDLRLNLDHDSRYGEMSKGMQDRLTIALVLSRRAQLYLLDEPLSGVDPVVRDQIFELLLETIGPDASLIISTHQVRDIERLFDFVCFLERGELLRFGSAEGMRSRESMTIDDLYKKIYG